MAKILIGITGSIAATKTIILIHMFTKNGHQCKTIVTNDGLNFVTPMSVNSMGAEVFIDDLKSNSDNAMKHIDLARWAEHIFIVPASANTIAKLAHGFADNLLMMTLLASNIKPIIVPAMNQQMWKNNFTQKNISILKELDIKIWGPKAGLQACGDNDVGRMLEADEIYLKFMELLNEKPDFLSNEVFNDLNIVITAGSTREAIDPVRYIGNHSSGKMGYVLAEEAVKLGFKVTLISGITNIEKPNGLYKFIVAKSAEEMLDCSLAQVKNASIFISCAAISDYKVVNYSAQKIKKTNKVISMKLTLNVDVVSHIKSVFPKLFVVGFAAETENIIDNAIRKLKNKNLDMIIANDVSNGQVFDKDTSQVIIINKELQQFKSECANKRYLAEIILKNLCQYYLINK